MKESVKVLQECAELQTKKSQDYQSSESTVVQAMHYRRGIDTIHDIILGKMMRMPGLPAVPASEGMNIDKNGKISGLS